MKKIILLIAIILIPLMNFAQGSIFEEFEDMDDVTTVVVTNQAFKLMAKISPNNDEAKQYVDMVKNLNELRVFTTENASIAAQMKTKVDSYLKSAKLTELMRVKDKGTSVKIFIREGKDEDHVSELLMFVNGIDNMHNQEAVILSLTGDIDLNKISELTDKMNISGGEHLKKAEK